MARATIPFQKFNRGIISPLGLARTDIERTAFAAEIQTNWMPRVLGSMMLRPGLKKILNGGDEYAAYIPLLFSVDDCPLIRILNGRVQFVVDEAVIELPSVSTTITNGTFTGSLTGWTDNDEAGGTSLHHASDAMSLQGDGSNRGIRDQTLTVAAGDTAKQHGLSIKVLRGLVTISVGSTLGDQDVLEETQLGAGDHILSFVPGATTVYLRAASATVFQTLVDSITMSASGAVSIDGPWLTADLDNIRYDTSGDVAFIACKGVQQYKITRRGTYSWSVEKFLTIDGPFGQINLTPTTITPSALVGNTVLTASKPLFYDGMEGSLVSITSVGQAVTASVSAANTFTSSIRVTGVGGARAMGVQVSGTWVGTITLQRSLDEATWTDITTYTNTSTSYNDSLDNQIIYYRIGFKTGNYTSGTASLTLSVSSGSIKGVVRLHTISSSTSALGDVVQDLGGTSASTDWAFGEWSDLLGYPSAVAFFEGRLWWAGRDKVWGSQSDGFYTFDSDLEGDDAPISRSVGSGPVETINWLLPIRRLVMGGQAAEISCKSSSFDEPLTPANFNLKASSTQGSAPVAAAKIDDLGVFVQRSGSRVYQMSYDSASFDYVLTDLTALAPEIGRPGIVSVAVQRQPDTRIHCVRSDGTAFVLVFDRNEAVNCLIEIETDGLILSAIVTPGDEEDAVYYQVLRTADEEDYYLLERWALESECLGGDENKTMDSFVEFGAGSATITGLGHMTGKDVVAYVDGEPLEGPFTVSAMGTITLPDAPVTGGCVGLPYTATLKTTKLAYGSQVGTALTKAKKPCRVGFILHKTHRLGLTFGATEARMDTLPAIHKHGTSAEFYETYDALDVTCPGGSWDTDSRFVLKARSPYAATVLAAAVVIDEKERG